MYIYYTELQCILRFILSHGLIIDMQKKRKTYEKKHTKNRKGLTFWDKEYSTSEHLTMSSNPSTDLKRFMKWIEREFGQRYVRTLDTVVDLGCGNARNLLYLNHEYNMKGVGYDVSEQALVEAKNLISDEKIVCYQRSIASPLDLPDESQALALDMMTSHFLLKNEREALISEINRVLRYDGWLFFKTFLRDEDRHAERLIKEFPAEEESSYIHPHIGVAEHVFSENEIRSLLSNHFTIFEIRKSHKHIIKGRAAKRRSISIYAQKK